MEQTLLIGEKNPTTDVVGPQVPTELTFPNRLTNELASQWEKDAQLLAQYGSPQQAELLRHCAQRLFEAINGEKDVFLTVTMAAQMSGYSPDHLGRLVREGKLTSYGRKGKPMLRLGDLPKKPAVVRGNSRKYDVDADARSTLDRARRVS
jgi:hypothetical protein